MLSNINRKIRYQHKTIIIPANVDPQTINQSIELLMDMPFCIGMNISIYSGYNQEATISLTDGYNRILNETPLAFFQDSVYKGFLPLNIEAAGRKIDLYFFTKGTDIDIVLDLVFVLSEVKNEKSFPYTYLYKSFTDTSKQSFTTSPFNLPVDMKQVNGIWIVSRTAKKGSNSYNTNDNPGWEISIRNEAEEILLDTTPLSLFRRFNNNLNGQFYPVRFNSAGQNIYINFSFIFPTSNDIEIIHVLFLCSNQILEL